MVDGFVTEEDINSILAGDLDVVMKYFNSPETNHLSLHAILESLSSYIGKMRAKKIVDGMAEAVNLLLLVATHRNIKDYILAMIINRAPSFNLSERSYFLLVNYVIKLSSVGVNTIRAICENRNRIIHSEYCRNIKQSFLITFIVLVNKLPLDHKMLRNVVDIIVRPENEGLIRIDSVVKSILEHESATVGVYLAILESIRPLSSCARNDIWNLRIMQKFTLEHRRIARPRSNSCGTITLHTITADSRPEYDLATPKMRVGAPVKYDDAVHQCPATSVPVGTKVSQLSFINRRMAPPAVPLP